ncbi:hypothetical protein M2440_002013 [Methylorubrum extorquens]|nr:hypothetical protein [Methylorubrum extorquens]
MAARHDLGSRHDTVSSRPDPPRRAGRPAARTHCRTPRRTRCGGTCRGVCRRQPQERAGRSRRRLDEGDRRHDPDLLCRLQCAGQADRGRRAGRPLHLRRPCLDGLCRDERHDPRGQPRQPPAQRHRPRGGQGVGPAGHARARHRSFRPAGRWTARPRQCRGGARGQVRQGRPRKARRLGPGEGPARADRERARGLAARLPRRSPPRHRLRDGCGERSGRRGAWRPSPPTATRRSSTRPR